MPGNQRYRGFAYVGGSVNRNASAAKNSSYLEMRFLIPKQNAEYIIGPNGCNIKRLHMEYCAMINISESSTSERILTVGGFDLMTVVTMIEDIITGLKLALLDDKVGDVDSLGWLLDETEVEYITGIDEFQLNQILENSGTHIDVFLMCCPQSSDRVIRIRGDPPCIAKCICSLYQLLEWCPPPACRQPYNSDNANEDYATDYGGYQASDDLRVQAMEISYEDDTNVSTSSAALSPYVENVADKITDKIKDERSSDIFLTVKYSVQSSIVGAIIGKNGMRLNQVRKESMATIHLDSDIQAEERILTITGKQEEVENAKFLLQMCIRHFCTRVD